MDERLTKRNSRIVDMYLDGISQDAIAKAIGISQSRVSQIINAAMNASDPKELARYKASMLSRIQDLLDIHTDRAMNENLPPAFTSSGRILIDENGEVVRDTETSRRETSTVLALLNRLSAMLGSDAPQKSQSTTDMHVRYTIEGVNPDVV